MAVDDRGQRRQIGFVAHMPFRCPAQARQRQSARAFRYPAQPQVRRVGEDPAHQRALIGGRLTAASVNEAVGEPRPGGYHDQKVGNPHTRQHRVEPGLQRLGIIRRESPDRRKKQLPKLDRHIDQLAGRGCAFHLGHTLGQHRATILIPFGETGGYG